MENKRKNVYIVIFVITTIITSCIAIYFGIMYSNEKKNLEMKTQELSSSNTSLELEKNSENNIEKDVVYKYSRPTVDNNNCINSEEGISYKISVESSISGLSCSVNEDKKSITLGINWDTMKNMYQVDSPTGLQGNYQTVTINNFSDEIVDVYIQGMGQAVGEETILLLMKDGTVEYIPVHKVLKTKDFKSYGKLNDVNNVIGFSAGIAGENNNGGLVASYKIIIAIREDGSFYNLQSILAKTGNY